MRHFQLVHQRHGHHGEGFVDFPQVHIAHLPAGFFQRLFAGLHGGGGEPARLLRVRGVADDARQRLAAQLLGAAFGHEHHGGCAVIDAGAGGGGDGAVFFEGGLEGGDFFGLDAAGAFVGVHHALALAILDDDGGDFLFERAGGDGALRALHAGDSEVILLLPREVVFGGAVFTEQAHAAAFFVGVFQAIEHHVVINLVVAQAVAAARFFEQVGRVGHAFHAAGHHHAGRACLDSVGSQHDGLHGRAANLVERDRARGDGQPGLDGGLPRGRLPLTGGEHIAEDDFIYLLRLQPRPFNGGLDDRAAEVIGRQRGEIALEAPHRGAGGGNDDDGFTHERVSFQVLAKRRLGRGAGGLESVCHRQRWHGNAGRKQVLAGNCYRF